MDEKQSNPNASMEFFQPLMTMVNQLFSGLPGTMSGQKMNEREAKPEGYSGFHPRPCSPFSRPGAPCLLP